MKHLCSAFPNLEATRKSIRERPSMYLGSRDIDKFSAFVGATMLVEDINKVPLENRIFPIKWDAFEQWVTKRTGYYLNGKSFDVARIMDADDPLGKWFEFYDEFRRL